MFGHWTLSDQPPWVVSATSFPVMVGLLFHLPAGFFVCKIGQLMKSVGWS